MPLKESESLVPEIDLSDDSIKNEVGSLSMDLGVLPTGQLLQDILPIQRSLNWILW